MKTTSYILLLLLPLLLVLAACSSSGTGSNSFDAAPPSGNTGETPSAAEGGEEGKIELRVAWWGGQDRHNRTLQAIELYEERNPHVTIKAEYSGFDGYFDKLTTQFAAGNAPDVIQYGGNLEEYVNQGVVLDLSPYVGKELDVGLHDEGMIETGTFDGKLYGVCLGSNAFGVILNKTVFEEAGVPLPELDWTIEDYERIAIAISESGVAHGSMDMTEEWFGVFLGQQGKQTHHGNQIGYEEQDVLEWFTLMDTIRKSGGIVPPEIQVQSSETPEQSMIVLRDVAIYYAASNQLIAFNGATEDEIIIHPAPVMLDEGHGNGQSLRPSQFFAGYSETKHPEEVAKFLDFMTNDLEATQILGSERGIPVNSEVRDNLAQTADYVDGVVLEFISYVSDNASPYTPNFPGYNENQALFQEILERMAFGQMDVEAAAKEFYTEMVNILDRYTD